MSYQIARGGHGVVRDGREYVHDDPASPDWQAYQRWVAAGNTAAPADHEPEPEPSRDERLLAAVDAAKAAVTDTKVFTARQAAVLSAVFDGLGKAITGEAP